MFSQQEQLHVAALAELLDLPGAADAVGPEVSTDASQQYALEGQVFVLAPTGIIGQAASDLFLDTDQKKELLTSAAATPASTAPTALARDRVFSGNEDQLAP